MSLEVQLLIGKTRLLCQENPVCKLQIVNAGNAAVSVAHPALNPDVPTLRVLDVKTGIEMLHKKEPRLTGTDYVALAPGGKIEFEFSLTAIASFPLPAEYEVSALVPYQGGSQRGESKPLRLRIVPVTPRNLALVSSAGRWSSVQYGVCINAASDPPQIVRHSFDIMSGGGVSDALPVADSHLRAAPVASVPPNGVVTHAQWIGWVENGVISFTHFSADLGASPVMQWKPAEPDFALVAPLASEAPDDSGGRVSGAALVWVGDPSRGLSSFQLLRLTPEAKVVPVARSSAGGTRPAWMMAHVRSTGLRFVTFAQNESAGATLFWQAWPDAGGPAAPHRLANWQGRCLGGGGMLAKQDTLQGACLIQGPQKTGSKIELINWQLDSDGKFKEGEHYATPWGYSFPVIENSVVVGPGGSKFTLLADAEGRWTAFDNQGEAKPLPPDVSRTRLPLAAAFMDDSEVALVVGQIAQGFKLMMLNGDPLPHRHG